MKHFEKLVAGFFLTLGFSVPFAQSNTRQANRGLNLEKTGQPTIVQNESERN